MKKRILALVLVFTIAFAGLTFATVEDLNLSEMTTDELISLKKAIAEELNLRLGDGDMIYAGTYVGGQDIKSGYYNITNTGDGYLTIYVYDSLESYQAYLKDWSSIDGQISHSECKTGGTLAIKLNDGELLYISRGEGICAPSAPSWAP